MPFCSLPYASAALLTLTACPHAGDILVIPCRILCRVHLPCLFPPLSLSACPPSLSLSLSPYLGSFLQSIAFSLFSVPKYGLSFPLLLPACTGSVVRMTSFFPFRSFLFLSLFPVNIHTDTSIQVLPYPEYSMNTLAENRLNILLPMNFLKMQLFKFVCSVFACWFISRRTRISRKEADHMPPTLEAYCGQSKFFKGSISRYTGVIAPGAL